MRVTVLVENTAERAGLLAEHGLAFWMETAAGCLLHDTGQGGALLTNAYRLQVPLEHAGGIVLSHGHYDHTGGLGDVLSGHRPTPVYAHPAALRPKFARNSDGTAREIGIPPRAEQALQRCRAQWVWTEQPTLVLPGVTVTGPIDRVTEFEDTGGPFFLDAACQQPDPLLDDQAVFFAARQGTVVLLGCAHAGIINTLQRVQQLTGGRHIHAVLGGMHLVHASAARVQATIDELRRLQIDWLGPAHCTGRAATAALWDAFPDRCVSCHVGTRIEFDLET